MLSMRTQILVLAMLSGLCFVSAASSAQPGQTQPYPNQPVRRAPDSLPADPVEPPPGMIIVNYQGGHLMIEAQNSTLSRVLRAASNQTGTVIDIPSDADERVVGVFGPGSVRDVFASLLNGSRFSYLMQGSIDDATKVLRLTLFVKPAGPPTSQPVRPAPQVVAKTAEAPTIPPAPQQAKPSSVEPNAAEQPAPELPRRRHRRR